MSASDEADRHERKRRFEAEALPHATRLQAFAMRLAGDPDRARELVQETWLRAFRAFDSFRPGTNARAWLFRILYRVFLDRARKEEREPLLSEEVRRGFEAHGAAAAPAAWDAWTPAVEARAVPREAVLAAVDSIPEPYRDAIWLVDASDLGYEEAADVLELPVGTVRSRLHRGRRALLDALVARGVGPDWSQS